jgi:hypothetical protein
MNEFSTKDTDPVAVEPATVEQQKCSGKDAKELKELLLFILIPLAICIIYGVGILVNKLSMNPFSWEGRSATLFFTLSLCSISWICLAIVDQKDLKASKWLEGLTDLDLYVRERYTPLDTLLAHYTNVATYGLFLMLLVYTVRPIAKTHPGLAAILIAVIFVFTTLLYALMFLRLAKRFVNQRLAAYLMVTLLVFLLDGSAIQMLIAGTPSN